MHLVLVADGIFSCSMQDLVPWPGIEAGPLHWECRVWVTGPPDKSHILSFKRYFPPLFPLKLFLFWLHWVFTAGVRALFAVQTHAGSVIAARGEVRLSCPAAHRSSSLTKDWTVFPALESRPLTAGPQEKSSPRILRGKLLRLLKWDFK